MCCAGINSTWKHKSLRAQAMSTTQGNAASPRGFMHGKYEPDHLLVLVHGILARYILRKSNSQSSMSPN